jgi:hypothetical protein
LVDETKFYDEYTYVQKILFRTQQSSAWLSMRSK